LGVRDFVSRRIDPSHRARRYRRHNVVAGRLFPSIAAKLAAAGGWR